MSVPQHPARPRAAHIEPLGDAALRIVLGDTLDPAVNRRVCALADRIGAARAAGGLAAVVDVVPAFSVVGVHYRPEHVPLHGDEGPFAALSRALEPLLHAPDGPPDPAALRTIEIPVCYGGAFGPDLEEIAGRCGMDADALVALHQQPAEAQQVYMIGFAPGFPYIGQLDPVLAVPRRATPRTSMPAGTVCIANRQSVVYPLAAPGGWNMIGRTPLRLFDPRRAEPCLLRPGDRIRFKAIDPAAFAAAQEATA